MTSNVIDLAARRRPDGVSPTEAGKRLRAATDAIKAARAAKDEAAEASAGAEWDRWWRVLIARVRS